MTTPAEQTSKRNCASAPDMILKHWRVVPYMAVILLFGLAGLVLGNPGTWPQWRGPQRDGSLQMSPWPDELDETHL